MTHLEREQLLESVASGIRRAVCDYRRSLARQTCDGQGRVVRPFTDKGGDDAPRIDPAVMDRPSVTPGPELPAAALDALTPSQRTLARLVVTERLTVPQIAEQLGRRPQTVAFHLRQLAGRLAKAGFAPPTPPRWPASTRPRCSPRETFKRTLPPLVAKS